MKLTKKDLINELKNYVEVLNFDKKTCTTENEVQILNNVIVSLEEMIKKSA